MKPSLVMLIFGIFITIGGFLSKADVGIVCGNVWMAGAVLLQKIEIVKDNEK